MPAYGFAAANRLTRALLAGWTIGSVLQYTSGILLGVAGLQQQHRHLSTPARARRQFRVPGVPLYTKGPELRLHRSDAGDGPQSRGLGGPGRRASFGTAAAYYSDFRGQRRPAESMSLGKTFPIRERMRISIPRGVLQHLQPPGIVPEPQHREPANPPTRSNGVLTGGFGYMNYTQITQQQPEQRLPVASHRTGRAALRVLSLGLGVANLVAGNEIPNSKGEFGEVS